MAVGVNASLVSDIHTLIPPTDYFFSQSLASARFRYTQLFYHRIFCFSGCWLTEKPCVQPDVVCRELSDVHCV